MARRSGSYIRLVDGGEVIALEIERERCLHMVAQFDRKGIQNTYWHTTLKRLNKRIEEIKEGDQKDG